MKNEFFQWSRRKKWLVISSIYFMIACWQTGVFVADNIANKDPARFGIVFLEELLGAGCSVLLLPLLLYFFKKYPLVRGKIVTRMPLYLGAWILLGVTLTVMLYESRTLLFFLLNLGPYHYGDFIPRMAMETIKQFFVFWLIYGIRMYIITLRESQEERLRSLQLRQELNRSRLQTLQMQLNPHFLFNTLNVISSTMYDDVKAADTMVADLSDLLRQTLNSINWEEHPLRKELELFTLYMKLMKKRFQSSLVYTTSIADETLDALVPGFILQPLVENSIRFSMEKENKADISLSAEKIDDSLVLTLTDNGPGIKNGSTHTSSDGIGLPNTVERLRTLYGANHDFQMTNRSPNGLCIRMRIPFHTERT